MADLRDQLQETLSGTYTIERELGGGGMSRVFVAEENRLRRKVVVKVLSPELAAGVSAERFEREIQMVASLQQAHIVPVLTVGETGGLPYYTMPFVEGESLRSRLAKTGPLPVVEVVGILRDVARALGYAHERGVVHRDIKPDNVLLSGGSAVVTDFGIAKALSASRTQSAGATLTQLGTSIGTPAYMAPEQAAGDPDVDHRADLYSLGCMAFELLTGQVPFAGRTPQRMMAAHMSENPPNVSDLRPDTPSTLADLVMRCMAKQPSGRPQTAPEIARVLENVTSASGMPSLPPILLGGRKMLLRALAMWAAAFVVVAILARASIVAIGLPDWVFPGSLAVMTLGLPAILFTAYVQRVARRVATMTPTLTPGGSPAAPQGTMATIAMKATPHVSWYRTTMGGVYAVGAFVGLIGLYMILRAFGIGPAGSLLAKGAIAKDEKVLVADFQSPSSDTTLGPVVTDAFRTSLGQSQTVQVLQVNTIRDVLRRMQRPANTRVDFALAREIATREGIKAVIDGDIVGLGGKFALTVRLLSAQSGEQLASFRETADGTAEVLPAIDKLTKEIRTRIGESLRSVQSAPPLEQVTTPSLEALKKFVQGTRAVAFDGDAEKGISLLEEAVAIDTGFAMAYRKLAVELNNRGQSARALELLEKAYQHRDRLSDAERYLLLGSYYQEGGHQDVAKSTSAYESVLEIQPKNISALNNVGNNYLYMRQLDKAEDAYARTVATETPPTVGYTNLMRTQWFRGKRDEAKKTLEKFRAALPSNPSIPLYEGNIAFEEGKYDSAATLFQRGLLEHGSNPSDQSLFAAALGELAMTRGRIADADRLVGQSHQADARLGLTQASMQASADSAFDAAWFLGKPDRAVSILDQVLARQPIEKLPAADRPYVGLVMAYAAAGRPDKAKELLASFDRSRRDMVMKDDAQDRHFMLGRIALAEKKYADAAREFRETEVGSCVGCSTYSLAQAYDLAGQADSAIAVFERAQQVQILQFGRFLHATYLAGSHKRLGELYEQKGQVDKAIAHYTRFIEIWKDADPELQPKVAEVKQKLARLQRTQKS